MRRQEGMRAGTRRGVRGGARRGARRGARGGAPAIVLSLYLALGSILLGAVTLAATTGSAAERDFRRSQALALAEAGMEEARAGVPPHGPRPLGQGVYSWTDARGSAGRRIVARGEVTAVSGAVVTRTVRALLVPAGRGWKIGSWEEGR